MLYFNSTNGLQIFYFSVFRRKVRKILNIFLANPGKLLYLQCKSFDIVRNRVGN